MDNIENSKKEVPRNRGIYLLPNLFTVGVLFSAFYAIIVASRHEFSAAAIAIFIGIILDNLDGRVARLTHTQTEFGAQMDSLSDMVCFGVAPALIYYNWVFHSLGTAGWLVAFFYCVCTALRLARFNSQSQSSNKRYFQGLATPAAAAVAASFLWVCMEFQISGRIITFIAFLLVIFLGLLKVSTIRYRSFKDFDLRGRVPFVTVLLIVLIFVLVSFDPPIVFLVITFGYAISGPLATLWYLNVNRRKRKKRQKTEIKSDDKDDTNSPTS